MTGQHQKFALLIANSHFDDPQLPDLATLLDDAEALGDVLEAPHIGGFQVTLLCDQPRSKIEEALEDFLVHRQPHDFVLVYVGGHGKQGRDGLLLATKDTKSEREISWLEAATLDRLLRRCRGRRQLLLLDCCQSGAFSPAMTPRSDVSAAVLGGQLGGVPERAVIASTGAFDYAWLADGGAYSIFTHHLVHGLRTGEADLRGRGEITVGDLFEYVRKAVRRERPEQEPHLWLFVDFPVVPSPLSPRQATSNADPSALDRRYLGWICERLGRISVIPVAPHSALKTVNLDRVYVPLFTGIDLALQVRNGRVVDWGVAPDGSQAEETAARQNSKRLPGLGLGESDVQPVIDLFEHQVRWEIRAGRRSAQGVVRAHFDAEHAVALQPRLVVTGDPGSGKSTLLRYTALCLAGEVLRRSSPEEAARSLPAFPLWQGSVALPIFVELRDLVHHQLPDLDAEATAGSFNAYLRDFLTADDPALAACYPRLLEKLEAGEAVILLDGLDEVPQAEDRGRREQIIALAHALDRRYPGCRVVFSSRTYAYAGDWQLPGFAQVKLAEMPWDRAQQLAVNLFREVMTSPQRADSDVGSFLEALARVQDRMRTEPTFWSSPLLFTMMVSMWLRRREDHPPAERLPVTRGGLYREAVSLMLERWTSKHRDGTSLAEHLGMSADELRQALELLANEHHGRQEAGSTASFRYGELSEALVTINPAAVTHPRTVSGFLSRQAGLVMEVAPLELRFTHLSFQEHLAACSFLRSERFPANVIERLLASPQHWREPVRLLAAELEHRRAWRELWELVAALSAEAGPPDERQHPRWWAVFLAVYVLFEHGPRERQPDRFERQILGDLTARIVALEQGGALGPAERSYLGQALAVLGDPRPGVGLTPAGLPDLAWVRVPSGPYASGLAAAQRRRLAEDASEFERRWLARDGAARSLSVPAFEIGRYPVTNAQFQAFVTDEEGYRADRWWSSDGREWRRRHGEPALAEHVPRQISNQPRVRVSWYEAEAFAAWLSGKLGMPIRLPSEAQWEKAARGEQRRLFPWGSDYGPGRCNDAAARLGAPCAVGIFPDGDSPYGVADMAGNVEEWTLSAWARDGRPASGSRPGTARAVRGGAWPEGDPKDLRVTLRVPRMPGSRVDIRGFRVAVEPA